MGQVRGLKERQPSRRSFEDWRDATHRRDLELSPFGLEPRLVHYGCPIRPRLDRQLALPLAPLNARNEQPEVADVAELLEGLGRVLYCQLGDVGPAGDQGVDGPVQRLAVAPEAKQDRAGVSQARREPAA